jgi:hypothetical protein
VQLAQLRGEVGAQLVGEQLAEPAVPLQRLGAAPAGLQRPHQMRVQRLDQRMLHQQPAQLVDERLGPTQPQLQRGQRQHRAQPSLHQVLPQARDPPPGQPGQRRPPPRRKCLTQ